jgi:hypothetical protein
MDFTCYEVEPGRVEIRPARNRRDWMDRSPSSFANRCVPLVVANGHGWEILCPAPIEISWTGGPAAEDITVLLDPAHPGPDQFVDSHFGNGILTFNPKLIFRTPPGYDLWVGGPPNEAKDGIAPLGAVIETDWMPYTFTMNWRFTRADHRVRFDAGEPIAFLFPIVRGLVETCEPRLVPLDANPELAQRYQDALFQRNFGVMREAGEQFQGWYAKGTLTDANVGRRNPRLKSRPAPFSAPSA